MNSRICEMFGIEFPIFAFSHCRDVVAAVSKAGGFGVLGAVAFPPEQLEVELNWIDQNVDGKPYGVDVVMPMTYVGFEEEKLEEMIPEGHRHFTDSLMKQYDIPELPEGESAPLALLSWSRENAAPLIDVALKHPIKLLVNALGVPPKDVIDKCHANDVLIAALIGKPEQAIEQKKAGTDIIVAQGSEAGGHTGAITTMVLIPQVVDAVAPTPVLAAGGIGSGRQMAAAMALGADGVWTGSIWLTVAESDTNEVLKEKMLKATSSDTVRSRSMTGKPARLLKTPWTEAWDGPDSPGPLPMPLQYMLNAEAQSRVHRYAHVKGSGAAQLIGSPVGQIMGTMNSIRRTRDVIQDMVTEYVATTERMQEQLQDA
jgi:NAD(P)H-dependent flavin oxidoreductase YrpB (nitropropane dioxygenase family)